MNTNHLSSLEPLEARIAPAAVLHFTDVDGDDITIRTSKGSPVDIAIIARTEFLGGNRERILELDFSERADVFEGTDVFITAKRVGNGDGLVNIGFIDASAKNGSGMDDGTGMHLGRVVIDGDLGQIDVGAGDGKAALKSLTVNSLGRFGIATQGANGDIRSDFFGKVGRIIVKTDISTASISAVAIGTLRVGGGIHFEDSNFIACSGALGAVKIGGNIVGDSLLDVPSLSANTIGSFSLGGSLLGRYNHDAHIFAEKHLGPVRIGGDVQGGYISSGCIESGGDITSVRIGGSLRGLAVVGNSNVYDSGTIRAEGDIGPIRIGGSMIGTTLQSNFVSPDTQIVATGSIIAKGSIKSVTVGGSLLAGGNQSMFTPEAIAVNASIISGKTIGDIKIRCDVRGELGWNIQYVRPQIYATGPSAADVQIPAIKSLTVKGSVEMAEIVAGVAHPHIGGLNRRDAQIGPVKIGGDFIASNLAAGPGKAGSDRDDIVSRIARVRIGGQLLGDANPDIGYGIAAQQIGPIFLGGERLSLKTGAGNDLVPLSFGPWGDEQIYEFAVS
jgi:hypothetical protein